MRVVSFVVAMLGSIAFQLSLTLWPQKLQPYAWVLKYIWLAWGLAALVWLVIWLITNSRNVTPPAVPPIAQPTSSIHFAPVITQVANPAMQIQEPARSAVQPAQPALEHNLVCINTHETALYTTSPFVYVDSDKIPEGAPRFSRLGGIANIANRPAAGSRGVAPVSGVRAHIVYRNDQKEVYSGYGAWVGYFSNRVEFPPAATQKLIVVCSGDLSEDGLVFGMTNPRSRSLPSRPFSAMRRVLENSPANHMLLLEDHALEIEVTLLNDEGFVLGRFNLKYERSDEGRFKLDRMP